MKKIASFEVDHRKIDVGMYISRVDGDITTYDIRMVKPNGGNYISNPALHTIEHIFATFARNSELKDKVIYVGPMGCRTGFYLLLRDNNGSLAINLVRDAMQYVVDFEGEIPGYSEIECGNYMEHDLEEAKIAVRPILDCLKNYDEKKLDYMWHYNQ